MTVNLRNDDEPSLFLVKSMEPTGVTGYWYAGHGQAGFPASIPNSALASFQILITFYYRELERRYTSPSEFLFAQISFARVAALYWRRLVQALFDRQTHFRNDRIKVLRFIIEQSIDNRNFRASQFNLMTEFYTNRWVWHPQRDSLSRYYRYLLESLAENGDLTEDQQAFRIAPGAMTTLDRYEQDDLRHRDQVRQQKTLAILTGALVLVGLLQVGTAAWKEFRSETYSTIAPAGEPQRRSRQ